MLEGIKTDIEKLIALYEAERSERERLQAELVRCGAENESCRKRIEDCEANMHIFAFNRSHSAACEGAYCASVLHREQNRHIFKHSLKGLQKHKHFRVPHRAFKGRIARSAVA